MPICLRRDGDTHVPRQGARTTRVGALALAAALALACADKSAPTNQPIGSEIGSGSARANRPRVVLDANALTALKSAADSETPAFATLRKKCNDFKSDQAAGFQGLEWAEAVMTLSLCYHATGQERWADLAVRYLTALLDDRDTIGDGRGGDEVVHRDSGYGIRAHAFGAALGYDWLYNAKAMTPALRARIGKRLEVWLAWYGKSGYLNDNAFSNYFWGYLSALSIAGLALDGESDAAPGWLEKATGFIEGKVIPGFAAKLSGSWAEGWQYGGAVSLAAAIVVRGFQTAKGVDYAAKMSWFRELVRGQLHELNPSRETAYSNGTHDTKPAIPSRTPLEAAILVLATSDPGVAAEARFIDRKLLPEREPRYPWLAMLASLSGDDEKDILADEPLSYHQAGPGTTFARSSWDRRAVWAAFQAGPRIAIDHQHNDQGHFEIWRGADGIFVDGGEGHAYATINHNTLLVDDARRTLRFSPNQGVWGRNSRTIGYSDDGRVVVVVGDIASAYDPQCVSDGCKERTVVRARRTFVFVRPNLFVIDDDVEVANGRDLVTWAGHVRAAPQASGKAATIEIGDSRADLTVLEPAAAKVRVVSEKKGSEDHPYAQTLPLGDVWRIEVPSPTGNVKRRIRVWISVANRGARQPAPATRGSSYLGATSEGPVSVTFAAGGTTKAIAPRDGLAAIAGLEPGKRYTLTAAPGGAGSCNLSITVDSSGASTASAAGALSVVLKGCADVSSPSLDR